MHSPAHDESDVRVSIVQANFVTHGYDQDVYNVVRARIRVQNKRAAPARAHTCRPRPIWGTHHPEVLRCRPRRKRVSKLAEGFQGVPGVSK